MKTIIHDLNNNEISFNKNYNVVNALKCNNNCIGCFSCWINTPSKCIIKDEFDNLTKQLSKTDELIIISKCRYGCYSNEVKKVLERCIGYVLPYFEIRNKEIHHQSRYKNKLKLSTYFYGNIDKKNKICVDNLVKSNAINLNVSEYSIKYVDNLKEIEKCIQ